VFSNVIRGHEACGDTGCSVMLSRDMKLLFGRYRVCVATFCVDLAKLRYVHIVILVTP
jgi:hypothetical protein